MSAVDVPFVVDSRLFLRSLRYSLANERVISCEPFGPAGLYVTLAAKLALNNTTPCGSIIVTQADQDGREWLHASIARVAKLPSYADLCALKDAVWGANGNAYQCFVSVDQHVNIHPNALHLWGHADGSPALPAFGAEGTI